MKCMEARRMITPFVKKELSWKETEDFLEHVENCRDCMDELELYFTAYNWIDLLDSRDRKDYDFEKMLSTQIRQAKRGIRRHKRIRASRALLVTSAELLLIVSMVFGVNFKAGQTENSVFQRAILRMQMERRLQMQEEVETEVEYETENFTD